ncbi:hypothetical protein EJ753_06905 [Campylobacter lari]|nr:hypothetical protein [Campylobacter lari]EAI7173972.1 hypothetical protein [Campylobacter coli]
MKLKDFDFRVWNTACKKYIDDIELISNIMCDLIHGATDIIEDFEIELWTGLYDENGKKIYENDILEFFDYEEGYRIIQVQYNTDYGFFYKENYYIEKINNIDNKEFIILGNIHENPELLKC